MMLGRVGCSGTGGPVVLPVAVVLLLMAAALPGLWASRSDAPRGVASPFVFDVKAKCAPPCQHSGICIRNDTCFCMRGYEGESCQYGIVTPVCHRLKAYIFVN